MADAVPAISRKDLTARLIENGWFKDCHIERCDIEPDTDTETSEALSGSEPERNLTPPDSSTLNQKAQNILYQTIKRLEIKGFCASTRQRIWPLYPKT
jgi:hypothetical protein